MTVNKILASALTAAIVAGIGAAPASARDKDVVVTGAESDAVVREVRFNDLNLASPAGAQKLVRRVRFAVNDVCMDAVGGNNGYLLQSSSNCKDKSWQGASPQIDRAVQRARDIAANGWSAIAPVAIRISVQ